MIGDIHSRGRKRTSVPVKKTIKEVDIVALRFEDMVIRTKEGVACHLNRFRYTGCPTIRTIDKKPEALRFAGRDEIVKQLYMLTIGGQTTTTQVNLRNLLDYFKYLDSIEFRGDTFGLGIMSKCIKHHNELALKGINPSKAASIREGLCWYLKKINRHLDTKKLPNTRKSKPSNKDGALDLESELKPIAKTLIRGFKGFAEAIKNRAWLEIHPIFDEGMFKEQVKAQKWRGTGGIQKMAFEKAMRVNLGVANSPLSHEQLRLRLLYNQASRNALFLFYMLTGMNRSVLAPIKHNGVIFKDIGNGRYVFESTKFRANYKDLDNVLGFSKNTKSLVENWVEVSKLMYERMEIHDFERKPFLPYFSIQGEAVDFSYKQTEPNLINKLISKLHGITVNARRFRNTKSDILIRATDSIFITAQSLNNEVSIVEKRYSNGVESDHKNNLQATMKAQAAIAKGQAISEAVEEAKVLHSDILSDYDYKKRLMKESIKPAALTPTGVRCQGGSRSKLEAELSKFKRAGIHLNEDEGKCTDFLSYFNCEEHLLIASTNDIWLMLSFREQLTELFGYIAKNSAPKEQAFSVKAMLDKTLNRLKNKSPKNYEKAKNKVSNGDFHPLYSNRYGLKNFFG